MAPVRSRLHFSAKGRARHPDPLKINLLVATPAGLEPATCRLEGLRSKSQVPLIAKEIAAP